MVASGASRIGVLLLGFLCFTSVLSAQADATGLVAIGWQEVELERLGTSYDRYFPPGTRVGVEVPLIVFLHDQAVDPRLYRRELARVAAEIGVALLLPRSGTTRGWGFGGDLQIVEESLFEVMREATIDPLKVSIAGHGSGAGYAYLLAYVSDLRFSAVFTLSAPFLPVSEIFDESHASPIRMYYGSEDPALRRDAVLLREQWDGLELEWEEEIRSGFGRSSWPTETIRSGFRFLVDRIAQSPAAEVVCTTTENKLCLNSGRFAVEVSFVAQDGTLGRGRVVAARTDDSGLFWFFQSSNWEILAKVLDGCAINKKFWVFSSASTTLDYRMTVTDLFTGDTRQYRNQAGSRALAIADTEAFESCELDG